MSASTSNPDDLIPLEIYTRYVKGVDYTIGPTGLYSRPSASASGKQTIQSDLLDASIKAANSIIEASQIWFQSGRCPLGPEGVARALPARSVFYKMRSLICDSETPEDVKKTLKEEVDTNKEAESALEIVLPIGYSQTPDAKTLETIADGMTRLRACQGWQDRLTLYHNTIKEYVCPGSSGDCESKISDRQEGCRDPSLFRQNTFQGTPTSEFRPSGPFSDSQASLATFRPAQGPLSAKGSEPGSLEIFSRTHQAGGAYPQMPIFDTVTELGS